jgi:hypothetical protein
MGDFTFDLSGLKLPALERIAKELADPSGPRWVAAGIFGGATNEDGESVAEYATYNEYGTTKIPKRPFLRTTMAKNGEKYAVMLKGALKGLAASGSSEPVGMALTAVGREMETDIVEQIKSNMPPPNSPATQARKQARPGGGYSGTLVDTGTMLGSVGFELQNDSGEKIA